MAEEEWLKDINRDNVTLGCKNRVDESEIPSRDRRDMVELCNLYVEIYGELPSVPQI